MSTSPPDIAAIIPAYNEAQYISNVLDVLNQVACLSEVIVVDDGSSDDTSAVTTQASAQDPKLRLVRHPVNRGKMQAVFTGLSSTAAPYILMLDANLVYLLTRQVEYLIQPVVTHQLPGSLNMMSSWTKRRI